MDQADCIYAKSINYGGTTLYDHLLQTAAIAEKIAESIGYDKETARLGGLFHDIGKAHPEFQKKLKGISKIDFGIKLRHELSSLLFLPLLRHIYWDPLIDMIVAHHRSLLNDTKKQGCLDLENEEGIDNLFERHSEGWSEWSLKALDILSALGIRTRPVLLEEAFEGFKYVIEYCSKKTLGWSAWKGVLNGADHFASALEGNAVKHLNTIFRVPDLSVFDERKNELFPLSFVSAEDIRPHTIVTAPTGAGKTDYLMRRCRGRVFYTLPFQASINAMYERFHNQLPSQKEIRLLHASSRISLNEDGYEEKVLQDKVGASIKVLTPHQMASLICGTRGFEALAVDIMGNDVILDEIHSYSGASMSMVLDIIKALLVLNCRIHIGSATMPTDLQNKVYELLGGENMVCKINLPKNILDTFDRHRIYKISGFDEILPEVENAIGKNKKVLIVCNKVDTAQKKYREFCALFPDVPKLLLHSRFKRSDRAFLERKLSESFDSVSKACIVISTQVVEVSLDISFDMMVTECSPLDSLIQRMGRVNRRRTRESIAEKRIRPVYIIKPPEGEKECLPYEKSILEKSFDQLPNDEVLHENELQNKIDAVFPEIETVGIETSLVWSGKQFLLTELCHKPSSVLIEKLNIESATAIVRSSIEKYEYGNQEERTMLEIPIPRSSRFRKFTNFGYSRFGSCPIIISDEHYNSEIGLEWKEIDNIL